MKNNPIIIGLVAACVSMAMMVAFSSMGLFVLIAVLLGPLPIYVAALGWGTRAALAAIIGVVVLTSFATDPANGAIIGMMIAAPAALAGHQANLAQSSQDGFSLHWYPLSRILFGVTLIIIVAIIAFGLLVDFDPTKLGPQIAKQLQPILPPGEGKTQLSVQEFSTALELNLQILPFILPSLWIGIHAINFLLGMHITRRMDVLARPDEDIAASVNLPQIALVILAISLAGSAILPKPVSYFFIVTSGAMVMAFSIVGLAIIHESTKSWSARMPLLIILYVMISMLFFPVYLFSFAGILKVIRGGSNGGATKFNE